MNNLILSLIFIVVAYLLGSIPFGLIIGFKIAKLDIREHGSKNIGATNVSRVVGKKWGIIVLVLDALKGLLACLLPLFFVQNISIPFQLLLGSTAILGHSFPIWLKFKGGKGVATSLGVFLAVAWAPTLITFGLWIIVFAISHIISFASLIAAAVFPIVITLKYWGTSDLKYLLSISLLITIFIFYTHRANIQRLIRREEKKLF